MVSRFKEPTNDLSVKFSWNYGSLEALDSVVNTSSTYKDVWNYSENTFLAITRIVDSRTKKRGEKYELWTGAPSHANHFTKLCSPIYLLFIILLLGSVYNHTRVSLPSSHHTTPTPLSTLLLHLVCHVTVNKLAGDMSLLHQNFSFSVCAANNSN